jgi:hypothetical protein
MSATRVLAVIGAGLAFVTPRAAGPAAPQAAAAPNPQGLPAPGPPKDADAGLFEPRDLQQQQQLERARERLQDLLRQRQAQPTAREPFVVCGMTIIPIDPAVDPKMISEVPDHVDYKIRRIPPPTCRR